MWPHIDESPWPADLPFPPGALVYDLVYRPERTLFLRQAEAAGCPVQGGLEMLIVQGAVAFELWTGQKPPLDDDDGRCERGFGGMTERESRICGMEGSEFASRIP